MAGCRPLPLLLFENIIILANSPDLPRLPGRHMFMEPKVKEGLKVRTDIQQDFADTSTSADVFLKMAELKFQ